MRNNFYYAFGVFLLGVFLFLVMFHRIEWFWVVIIPLALIFIHDIVQKKHAILRNFPVLGHLRYVFEFIRPEIRQYFIAGDQEERPYDRETRTLIYERSKNVRDTIPFGTQRDILAVGYEWTLHSMNALKPAEVEPRIIVGSDLCTQPYSSSRLNISGMSFGALSANAVMAMNLGAKLGNFAQATGEGGLSPYHLQGGDVIWQIGTGYFGCRDEEGHFDPAEFAKEANRPEVKMIELKLSQGAKPSHGGILPAAKLTPEIAAIRKAPMGHDVLSPGKHSAFNGPTEMMHFIQKLRELCHGKPVGVKLCLGIRHEFFAMCKAMLATGIYPDFITVDGAEGGTGAAPVEFVNHVGTPLSTGLQFVDNALRGIGLRDKIRIAASGKIATGFDMVTKLAIGADICNMARPMMMATGCIQSMQCNTNTCPTGVATQDKRLQKALVVSDKKHRVANFHEVTLHSFLEIIGAMGLKNPSELTRDRLYRRLNANEVKSFAEIYPHVETGCFVTGNVPEIYKQDWDKAQADRF
jgi:glutamate synthase domain-containing protein 2